MPHLRRGGKGRRVIEAYAAGLFDGEGCVFINRSRRKGYQRADGQLSPGYLSYTLVVTVTNSCYAVLEMLQNRWGGAIIPKSSLRARRPIWNWQANRAAAVPFLRDIYPFAIAKSDQIEIALAYHNDVPRIQGPVRRTEDQMALREGYYQALRQMKRPVGVAACLECYDQVEEANR